MNSASAALRGWTAAGVLVLAAACQGDAGSPATSESDAPLSPAALLASLQTREFPRPDLPWRFRFPADHGAHERYRTEWWHLAGALAGRDGRRLAVQLSVARIGLRPGGPPEHASNWATNGIYAGLLTISAGEPAGTRSYRRISRAALGLAGARTGPVEVWIEDWRLTQIGGGRRRLDLKLHAAAKGVDLELELRSTRPLIDTGDFAADPLQPAAPVAFYIQPRLKATGTIRIEGEETLARGAASLEHAWGELPFPGGPVARDRFTLFLDDGRALVCLRTHRVDGSGTPAAGCLLAGGDGGPAVLSGDELALIPREHWTSPETGARYPVRWVLRTRALEEDLEIVPDARNQEGAGWAPFWAGPVRLRVAPDKSVGYGLVQLNGYDDS